MIHFSNDKQYFHDLSGRWSEQRANDWKQKNGWLVGCNYIPASAINQLEMWQEESFNIPEINKELSLAHELGFNTIRVFLHHLLWEQDKDGFINRLDQFLAVAANYHIKPMLVLFDGVWNPYPKPGKQSDPKKNVHNSGWVQSPGMELLKNVHACDNLKGYIEGVVSKFKDDDRILMWDMFNEPDNLNVASYREHTVENLNKASLALTLLKKTHTWIKSIDPIHPVTAGPWQGDWTNDETLSELDYYMFHCSDIITFHSYEDKAGLENKIRQLLRFKRPMLCTEYMARPFDSTFQNVLPVMKYHEVGAYNWGLVAGKTQTNCAWESWDYLDGKEPEVWFHDIFHPNGEPYNHEEVSFLKMITRN